MEEEKKMEEMELGVNIPSNALHEDCQQFHSFDHRSSVSHMIGLGFVLGISHIIIPMGLRSSKSASHEYVMGDTVNDLSLLRCYLM